MKRHASVPLAGVARPNRSGDERVVPWARSVAALVAGIVAATVMRAALVALLGPTAPLTGLAFAGCLHALAIAAGWLPGRMRPRDVGAGVLGGAVLVALPFVAGSSAFSVGARAPLTVSDAVVVWAVVVSLVGATEEFVFRGVLLARLARQGLLPAVTASAMLFGLVRVPFYGWGALPIDMAAGLWLGWLRASTGSPTAPVVAHVLADWSTWVLR